MAHNHHSHESSSHHSSSKKRWIKKKIKKYLINGSIIALAALVVFLLDFYNTTPEDPEESVDVSVYKVEEEPETDVPVEEDPNAESEGLPEEELMAENTTLALPRKTYAYIGEPIVYYFLNLTGYNSLDDIQVEMETGGKGKIYKDRWVYTPKKAETFTIKMTVRNKKDKVVCDGTCTIEVKSRSEKKKLNVLVIGDSTISAGYETENLLKLAQEDGYELNLLGTLIPQDLDNSKNRHEGRSAWRAEHYAAVDVFDSSRNPFYNPTAEKFDFLYYMESQMYAEVDCVCIQLGSYDVFSTKTNVGLKESTIPDFFLYMDAMIESIHAYDPDIKILWNMILPGSTDQSKFDAAYDMGQTADRYKINTYLTNLEIIKHVETMENVYAVPIHASLNVDGMAASSHGAIHPRKQGYDQLSTALYSYLRGLN